MSPAASPRAQAVEPAGPKPAARVARPDAIERVVNHVRTAIGRGDLNPGDRLPPEREMATRLRVSRATVRSALRVLAGMGVVQIRQGAGTFISGGPAGLHSQALDLLAALHGFTRRQMFEARLVLEVALAGYAAQRGTADALIALSDETTAMFASLDDAETFLLHDMRFHRAVAEAADNPLLASVLETMTAPFEKVRQHSLTSPAALKLLAEEHRAIYRAVRSRDAERAKQAMLDHLRRAEPLHAREPAPRRGLDGTG